eukprot:5611645-Pyramimonas_sp.AAC.1
MHPDMIEPMFCIDSDMECHSFVHANFKNKFPDLVGADGQLKIAFHNDTEVLNGTECKGPKHQDLDLLIGGWPCKPFSIQNLMKFMRSTEEKMSDPMAKPFFDVSAYLRDENFKPPKFVILENVRGLLKSDPSSGQRPIDFILLGKDPDRGEFGLALNKRYSVQWFVVSADQWGLPHVRSRVYIVMVRKDILARGGGWNRFKNMMMRFT